MPWGGLGTRSRNDYGSTPSFIFDSFLLNIVYYRSDCRLQLRASSSRRCWMHPPATDVTLTTRPMPSSTKPKRPLSSRWRAPLLALIERLPVLRRMDGEMQIIASEAAMAFVLRVLGFVLSFLFSVALARTVGSEGAGIYFQAFSVLTIAMIVGRFGLHDVLLRYAAAHHAQGHWAQVRGVARQGLRLSTLIACAVTVLVFLLAEPLALRVFDEPRLIVPLRLFSLVIVPASLNGLLASLIRAVGEIELSMLVSGTLLALFSLPLLLVLHPFLGVLGAVLAYGLAVLLTFALGVALWRRFSRSFPPAQAHFPTQTLLRTTVPIFWITLFTTLLTTFDTVLLGVWLDSADVGIYAVAQRATNLTMFALVAVNLVISPRFAVLVAQEDQAGLQRLVSQTMQAMLAIALLVTLPFLLAPEFILSIMGSEFQQGREVLLLLALGQLVNVATGPVGRLLIMSGHERLVRNNVIAHVLLNIALNIIFIPLLGITGAALVSAGTIISKNLVAVFLVWRVLRIRIWGRTSHDD